MVVYDPVRNRHFKIGAKAFALLSRWHEGSVQAVMLAAHKFSGKHFEVADFENLLKFLSTNSLIETKNAQDVANLLSQYRAANQRDLAWFGRNLFFFASQFCVPSDC